MTDTSTEAVKRYDFYIGPDLSVDAEESPVGDFVYYSDYEALAAERDALKEREQARERAVIQGLELAHKELSDLPEYAQKAWALEAIVEAIVIAMMRQSDALTAGATSTFERIEELKANLAKAVEGLSYYACDCIGPCEQLNGTCGDHARAILSELTGGKDD